MWFFSNLVIVICYLQTKFIFASQDGNSCPFISEPNIRNTSLWSEFVRTADFINVDEAEAIQELVAQTTELKAIFNHFKELYVSFFFFIYHYLLPIGKGTSVAQTELNRCQLISAY